jgi:hypothetical protein
MGAIMPSKMPTVMRRKDGDKFSDNGVEKRRKDGDEFDYYAQGGKTGLYENIHAKRKRIAAGSGERMRKVGSKGAPTDAAFRRSAKTAKR